GRPKARRVAILLTVLEGEDEVQPIILVEHVIPPRHRLFVMVLPDVAAVDEVIVQIPLHARGWLRVITDQLLSYWAQAVERNDVAGERVADVGAPRPADRAEGRRLFRPRTANVRGARVVDRDAEVGEVLAVAQQFGR